MLSPFVVRKNSLAFYRFDVTGDGLVAKDDFEVLGKRQAKYLGVNESTDEYTNLVDSWIGIWQTYYQPADTDNDGAITSFQLIDFLSSTPAASASEYPQEMGKANKRWFDSFDLDGNGTIELNEYQSIFVPLGFSEEELVVAFGKLTEGQSDTISRDEFNLILWDYYWRDDRDAKGNYFFGGQF